MIRFSKFNQASQWNLVAIELSEYLFLWFISNAMMMSLNTEVARRHGIV